MKKFSIIVALGIATVLLLLQVPAVKNTLVSLSLPPFPDWPAPLEKLDADATGKVYYQTASPFDLEVILNDFELATPTTGLGYLTVPDAASAEHSVPAMIILPGSGGIQPGREHEYAELLKENGIAAFVVEYYLPRGVDETTNYVVRVSAVTEFDLITDAYSALKLLSTSPVIDPGRIGVMGFSYGGMASRLAMDERIHQVLAPDSPGFAVYVDFYGPCFQDLNSPATNGAPLLTLRGTEDNSNDLEACKRREKELRGLGVTVESHVYTGAGHAWEVDKPRELGDHPYITGCELEYNDKGQPLINGEALKTPPDTSRVARIAARLSSSGELKECLKHGYIVGRDEKTTALGYAALLRFLDMYL